MKLFFRIFKWLVYFFGVFIATNATGQFTSFEQELLAGFSNDGRVKILILTLSPYGISETASDQILQIVQENLNNTKHFTVVGPSEWQPQLSDKKPHLVNCTETSCAVQIGRLFNADKVMTGQLKLTKILDSDGSSKDGFVITLQLISVATNTLDLEEEIRFIDENMNQRLFQMANRVSQNTLLSGRVLSVGHKSVMIDLGKVHGLKIGDRLVVYSRGRTTAGIQGETLGLEQRKISILEVVRINEQSSEAIAPYAFGVPEVGQWAKTYVNRQKQIELVSEARRELDTQIRLIPPVKPRREVLQPQILASLDQSSQEKQEWQQALNQARRDKRTWLLVGGASAGVAIVSFLKLIPFSQTIQQMGLIGGLIGSVYGGVKYVTFSRQETSLLNKGRIKKWISFQIQEDHLVRDGQTSNLPVMNLSFQFEF